MYRIIDAKQIVGSIVIELINQRENTILIKDVFKIGQKIDNELNNKKLNASLLMSINDVCQVVNSYENIIKLEKFNLSIQNKYINEDFSTLVLMLEDYFISGIPNDINQVIRNCVREWYNDGI